MYTQAFYTWLTLKRADLKVAALVLRPNPPTAALCAEYSNDLYEAFNHLDFPAGVIAPWQGAGRRLLQARMSTLFAHTAELVSPHQQACITGRLG